MGQRSSRIGVALGLAIVSVGILAVVLWGERNGGQAPPARPARSESAAPRGGETRAAVLPGSVATAPGMPLGTEFIDVTASGFVGRGPSVRVSGDGPTQSCTVTMSPADALVVRVVDEQSREPVKGAWVTPILGARGGIDTWKVPLIAGENGEVRFSVGASTACSLRIDGGERYERYEQPDLPPGTHFFEAALHPTAPVSCRVEGASGALVTDCTIEYQRDTAFEREHLHRDDGVFPVRWQSRPRPARFRVVHPVLGSSDWDAIRPAPSGGEPILVKLTPPALIRGVASFVPPLAGGRAIAELWSTSQGQPRILTGPRVQQEDAGLVDVDGSFALHAKSGGAYLLRVVAAGYGAASRVVQILGAKPGNEPSIAAQVDAVRGALGSRADVGTLTLSAGAEVSVTALHGRAPAPYAEVWILPDESTSPLGVGRSVRADSTGDAVFRDVAAGKYRVAAAEPGLDPLPPIGAIVRPGPRIEVRGGESYRVTASY